MEPINAADRKSIRAAEKAARIAERQRHEVIAQIMSTIGGRAWLWDHLSSAHCFHTTHVFGDALASAFQEGRRSLGLELLTDILRSCPDLYIQAMRESNERHLRHDRNPDDPVPASGLAERPGSPLDNGGDSGALAADDPDAASVDYDIYRTETPGQ